MRSLVQQSGLTVCGEAEDGTKAIEFASQLLPDLILLDYSMPGMNGAETASVLKLRLPNVPIILFTLHADDVNEVLRKSVNVDFVLGKSDGMDNLISSVKTLLGISVEPVEVGPIGVIAEIPSVAVPKSVEEKPVD